MPDPKSPAPTPSDRLLGAMFTAAMEFGQETITEKAAKAGLTEEQTETVREDYLRIVTELFEELDCPPEKK